MHRNSVLEIHTYLSLSKELKIKKIHNYVYLFYLLVRIRYGLRTMDLWPTDYRLWTHSGYKRGIEV